MIRKPTYEKFGKKDLWQKLIFRKLRKVPGGNLSIRRWVFLHRAVKD
jgi:hypothetical protein